MRQVQLPFAPVPAMPASLPQTASTCGVTRIPPPAPKRPRPTTRSMGREAKRQATEAVPRCSSEPTATPPTDGVAVAQISWRNCKPQTPTKLKVEVAKAEEDLNSNSVVEDTAGLPVVHNIPSAVLQKPKGTPAYIIDKHHDALLPIFGGIFDTQTLPSTGLKLLHLDSHPDMACLPDNTPKTLMAGLHKGAYNHTHLHKKCDIATWVLPLVLGGHVDEVVWMCSWWCLQMEPGTYELQIGVQQNVMKVAPMVDSDQTEEGVGLYWMSSNSWVPAGTLKDPRPWKLHVCRLTRAGQLQDKDVQLIRRVTGSGPWLLDFDEDFVSCCNPFQEEFKAFFGVPQYSMLRRTYEPKVDAAEHWDQLQTVVAMQTYREDKGKFLKNPTVQKLRNNTSDDLLVRYQELLQDLHAPTGGKMVVADLFPPGLVHYAGESSGLPHHISSAGEIVTVVNTVQQLLAKLSPPQLITVATSRTDKYLPDSQATRIHRIVCQMLCRQYSIDAKSIVRLDKPESSVPLKL